MRLDPAQRFQAAAEMLRAVRNIRKLDRRWKQQNLKKDVAAVILAGLFVGSAISTFVGIRVMAQEKEDHYSMLIYALTHEPGDRMEALFAGACVLYPGRIEAYCWIRAVFMALYWWSCP
jgi:hypothetical protein